MHCSRNYSEFHSLPVKVYCQLLVALTPSETLGKVETFQKNLKSNTSYLVTCVFHRISQGRKIQPLQALKCDLFSVSNFVRDITAEYSELSLPLYLGKIYRSVAQVMTNSLSSLVRTGNNVIFHINVCVYTHTSVKLLHQICLKAKQVFQWIT